MQPVKGTIATAIIHLLPHYNLLYPSLCFGGFGKILILVTYGIVTVLVVLLILILVTYGAVTVLVVPTLMINVTKYVSLLSGLLLCIC
jgi:hypothetical protein